MAHLGYNLYGQFVKTNNQYYFTNTVSLPNLFNLEYATEQRLSAVAEISWSTLPLSLRLLGKYHSYTLCSGDPAWFKPDIEVNFTARYQWRERIIISSIIDYRGETSARLPQSNLPSVGALRTFIDGYTDIGLTLEYRFASWFGIYAEGKNLLNAQKQNFLFYYEPGLRIGGGVTFRF